MVAIQNGSQLPSRVREFGVSNAVDRQVGVTVPGDQRFGAIGMRTGFLLHLADIAHMRVIQTLLSEIGLTATRATALAFIRENPECGQTKLGQALEINRASTMEVVNALVQMGAVERRSGFDKRSKALVLTPTGHDLYAQFDAISVKVDEIIAGELSAQDAHELARLLSTIRVAAARFTTA